MRIWECFSKQILKVEKQNCYIQTQNDRRRNRENKRVGTLSVVIGFDWMRVIDIVFHMIKIKRDVTAWQGEQHDMFSGCSILVTYLVFLLAVLCVYIYCRHLVTDPRYPHVYIFFSLSPSFCSFSHVLRSRPLTALKSNVSTIEETIKSISVCLSLSLFFSLLLSCISTI